MSWQLWRIALVLVLAFTVLLSAQTSDPRPTLTVIVDDRSSAGAAELGAARTRAGYVFDGAGIRITWMTQGRAQDLSVRRDYIYVVVLDRPADEDLIDGHQPVLGFAVPAANRVYVYFDRVQRLALDRRVQPGWFLGVVIAHELAHVLLPHTRHTTTGVMAATLGPDPTVPPTFTGQEARAMRARLGGEATLAFFDFADWLR